VRKPKADSIREPLAFEALKFRDRTGWSNLKYISIQEFTESLALLAAAHWSNVARELARALRVDPNSVLTQVYVKASSEQTSRTVMSRKGSARSAAAHTLEASAQAEDWQLTRQGTSLGSMYLRRDQLERLLRSESPSLWQLIDRLSPFRKTRAPDDDVFASNAVANAQPKASLLQDDPKLRIIQEAYDEIVRETGKRPASQRAVSTRAGYARSAVRSRWGKVKL
jgi:hypothetical protein